MIMEVVNEMVTVTGMGHGWMQERSPTTWKKEKEDYIEYRWTDMMVEAERNPQSHTRPC